MTDLANASRRWLAGITLAMLAVAPAFASDYNIKLFENTLGGNVGAGAGSFQYANPGNAPRTDPVVVGDLATNASSVIGVRAFNSGTINVQVVRVDFNDAKTPPNQISGYYVEGLTGTLETAAAPGLQTGRGPCAGNNLCFYRITFAFVAAVPPANAATALKTYNIDLIQQASGNVAVTNAAAGTYAVSNVATIPEPGSLALVLIACTALAWQAFRRSRRCGGLFAKAKSR